MLGNVTAPVGQTMFMSVNAGLSILRKSALIFSLTLRTSLMNVKVPRPASAAFFRK